MENFVLLDVFVQTSVSNSSKYLFHVLLRAICLASYVSCFVSLLLNAGISPFNSFVSFSGQLQKELQKILVKQC